MTTKPPSAERRKKVAEAVTRMRCEVIHGSASGIMIHLDAGDWRWWNPGNLGVYELSQKDVLTRTTARLIEEAEGPKFATLLRFNGYLVTDNTNAIEVLLSELLETPDGK